MAGKYGMPSWLVPITWLAGPLAGLLQPIIGAFSDSSTFALGRRRPFIIIGTLFSILSYALFIILSFDLISNRITCLIVAVTAFVVLQLSLNILMLPARAIVGDLSGPGQETLGTYFISFAVGVGNAISFACAAFLDNPFYVYLSLLVLFVLPTIFAGREVRYVRQPGETVKNPFIITFRTLLTIIKGGPILRAGLVYLMSWAAYFSFNTYGTSYCAEVIYQGEQKQKALMAVASEALGGESSSSGFPTPLVFVAGLLAKVLFSTGISQTPSVPLISSSNTTGSFSTGMTDIMKTGASVQMMLSTSGATSNLIPPVMMIHSVLSFKEALDKTMSEDPSLSLLLSQSNVSYTQLGHALLSRMSNERTADDRADDYRKGIMIGSLAMLAQSFLTSFFSLIGGTVQKLIGLRPTYFLSQLIATVCLISLWIPQNADTSFVWLVFVTYTLMGLNFAQFNSVPFAIVNQSVSTAEMGAYNGAMNIFCLLGQTISQVIISIADGAMSKYVGGRHKYQWFFFINGLISVVATLVSLILKEKGPYDSLNEAAPNSPINNSKPDDSERLPLMS